MNCISTSEILTSCHLFFASCLVQLMDPRYSIHLKMYFKCDFFIYIRVPVHKSVYLCIHVSVCLSVCLESWSLWKIFIKQSSCDVHHIHCHRLCCCHHHNHHYHHHHCHHHHDERNNLLKSFVL